MSRLRILHISDFHFCIEPNRQHWLQLFSQNPISTVRHIREGDMSSYPSSYSDEIAENAARFIFEKRRRFDVAVISGDLATTGLDDDLAEAHRYVSAPATGRWLSDIERPTIRGGARVTFLLPGNHDRYRDNEGNAGGKRFDSIFSDEWSPFEGNIRPDVRVRVLRDRKDGSRSALIAADFCLRQNSDAQAPIRFNRWGRGRAYEEIVNALEEETDRVRQEYPPLPVIWVIHFPPSIPCKSVFSLIDDQLVVEAAHRKKIPIILSGHLHKKIEGNTKLGTQIFCAGSMTSSEEDGNHWLHLIELNFEGEAITLCKKIDFLWNDDVADFSEFQSAKYEMAW